MYIHIFTIETVTIGFLNETYTVSESRGYVTLLVGITSGAAQSVSVDLIVTLMNGTAFGAYMNRKY